MLSVLDVVGVPAADVPVPVRFFGGRPLATAQLGPQKPLGVGQALLALHVLDPALYIVPGQTGLESLFRNGLALTFAETKGR